MQSDYIREWGRGGQTLPTNLDNSYSDNDADFQKWPPEDAGMIALQSVPMTGLPGLEKLLVCDDFT